MDLAVWDTEMPPGSSAFFCLSSWKAQLPSTANLVTWVACFLLLSRAWVIYLHVPFSPLPRVLVLVQRWAARVGIAM
jgi:hypothetical protein